MRVRVKIRAKGTEETRELKDEGDDYAVVRDSLFAQIPEGWQALHIAVDRSEIIR